MVPEMASKIMFDSYNKWLTTDLNSAVINIATKRFVSKKTDVETKKKILEKNRVAAIEVDEDQRRLYYRMFDNPLLEILMDFKQGIFTIIIEKGSGEVMLNYGSNDIESFNMIWNNDVRRIMKRLFNSIDRLPKMPKYYNSINDC